VGHKINNTIVDAYEKMLNLKVRNLGKYVTYISSSSDSSYRINKDRV